MNGMPRIKVAAANPAMSPITPPPKATSKVFRFALNFIKKSKISDSVSRFLYSSPSAKTHVLTRTPEFCKT